MNNLTITKKELRGKYVTLDCNIFILFVIGTLGKQHIQKFKRTRIFKEEDFDVLISLLSESIVILTPNVLTEASNLLESYKVGGQNIGLKGLKIIIESIEESYEKSNNLIELVSFEKFGLSDSSIDNLCQNNVIAITVDLPLYGYLVSKSYPVINFNHVRTAYVV
ncbi:hypothetical protein ES705_40993 [subsurface metagenome]